MSSGGNKDNSFDLSFIKNLKMLNGDKRYLICPKCYGYYPLKENESPDDFLECECGNDLEFYENIDDFVKLKCLKDSDKNNLKMLNDNYNELQEIESILKNKSEKRKEFLKELSMRIKLQEDLLTDINYGKSRLWDTIEEKSLHTATGQNTAAENMMVQEDAFLVHVKKHRRNAERIESHYFIKISAILFAASAFMLLILYLTI